MNESFVLGVFSDTATAKNAVDTLQNVGFTKEEISVLVKDSGSVGMDDGNGSIAAGAATGATTGGALGALGGFLIGIGALTIPGIGPLLAGGPLLAALGITGTAASTAMGAAAGVATGAVTGGIAGALVKKGVSEDEAKMYEDRLSEGAVILGISTQRLSSDTAVQTLQAQGAESVTQVG